MSVSLRELKDRGVEKVRVLLETHQQDCDENDQDRIAAAGSLGTVKFTDNAGGEVELVCDNGCWVFEAEGEAHAMNHFIKLAKRGKPGTGASGGELRARRLALAVLNDIPGLDTRAITGFCEFIELLQHDYEKASKLVDADDE
jgi:hypothetical protein